MAALALAGCKRAPAPPAAPVEAPLDCSPGHLDTLVAVMRCRMAPFAKGRLSEVELRETLVRLRELAPDPAWSNGDYGWPQIVDRMLQGREYSAGCKECHRAYLRPYRKSWRGRRIAPPL